MPTCCILFLGTSYPKPRSEPQPEQRTSKIAAVNAARERPQLMTRPPETSNESTPQASTRQNTDHAGPIPSLLIGPACASVNPGPCRGNYARHSPILRACCQITGNQPRNHFSLPSVQFRAQWRPRRPRCTIEDNPTEEPVMFSRIFLPFCSSRSSLPLSRLPSTSSPCPPATPPSLRSTTLKTSPWSASTACSRSAQAPLLGGERITRAEVGVRSSETRI